MLFSLFIILFAIFGIACVALYIVDKNFRAMHRMIVQLHIDLMNLYIARDSYPTVSPTFSGSESESISFSRSRSSSPSPSISPSPSPPPELDSILWPHDS